MNLTRKLARDLIPDEIIYLAEYEVGLDANEHCCFNKVTELFINFFFIFSRP